MTSVRKAALASSPTPLWATKPGAPQMSSWAAAQPRSYVSLSPSSGGRPYPSVSAYTPQRGIINHCSKVSRSCSAWWSDQRWVTWINQQMKVVYSARLSLQCCKPAESHFHFSSIWAGWVFPPSFAMKARLMRRRPRFWVWLSAGRKLSS